jgi:hypothetical protein
MSQLGRIMDNLMKQDVAIHLHAQMQVLHKAYDHAMHKQNTMPVNVVGQRRCLQWTGIGSGCGWREK